MRCKTAQECYMKNRDGLLDEIEKMELERHIQSCRECASFAVEMDRCLSMLDDLPQMEAPDNFEWNLRRRIAMEKARVMRERAGDLFTSPAWGAKFIAGAAAVLVVALAGSWFFLHQGAPRPQNSASLAEMQGRIAPAAEEYADVSYTSTGYPAGIRMVSDDLLENSGQRASRHMPFSMESERRIEYLVKENEILKKNLEYYKRENLYLKKMLLQQGSRR